MGAEQSSECSSAGADEQITCASKTCYYEVLGVDRLASDEEIKKAYRKKALELHPDRNYGDVDNATKLFAEVQSAYEVLSDPQERAWYDSHREAILRNDQESEGFFDHNIRMTSAGDIITFIGRIGKRVPFTNTREGFYGGLRSMFEKLAKEENAASEWEGLETVHYPDFGAAEDGYEEVVRPFYVVWTSFSTQKTFSWLETYKYTDAPDRRIRRLMEKENKKLRDEGIREFNDAVRSLVVFVRKRDPRFLPNKQSESDRQKILRGAAAAQAARSRAANQAKLAAQTVPEWVKSQQTEETSSSDSESPAEEQFECVTCDKIFKSDKQYEAHAKSKKHIKAVQLIKKQMEIENKLFKLQSSTGHNDETISDPFPSKNSSTQVFRQERDQNEILPSSRISRDSRKSESILSFRTDSSERDIETPSSASGHPEQFGGEFNSENLLTSNDDLDQAYASKEEIEARLARLLVIDSIVAENHNRVGENTLENAPDELTLAGNKAPSAKESNAGLEQRQTLGKAKVKKARKATNRGDITGGNVQ